MALRLVASLLVSFALDLGGRVPTERGGWRFDPLVDETGDPAATSS